MAMLFEYFVDSALVPFAFEETRVLEHLEWEEYIGTAF
ncbi:hypothetical protein HNQ88_002250 [Aureibacter tunicatorum]|uniref:Uncharacterized protein n=1 Tax=Aureibacter tunicatorum TaxID=866807 RepID=A0AAE3XNI1_9BACT|nr:hypothetical protein [Aureibacter tunicatorum]